MSTTAAHRHAVDIDDLLALALSRPVEALARSLAVLATRPQLSEAAVAHQVIGIVLRDRGDTATAKLELRHALRLERQGLGRAERIADVLASLGITDALSGNPRRGLTHLSKAASLIPRCDSGRVLTRRAYVLAMSGRYEEALADLNEAVSLLHLRADLLWEARARTHRGLTHIVLGDTRRADRDFEFSERYFAHAGQEFEHAMARHNRGLTAAAAAQLPRALTLFHEARERYAELNVFVPELAIDECTALMAAGLAEDALLAAEKALDQLRAAGSNAASAAELALVAARAALAAGKSALALEGARAAQRLFAAQGRDLWTARAQLLSIEAGLALATPAPSAARRAGELAARLGWLNIDESTRAHLIAGRVALASGHTALATRHLNAAARSRLRGSAIDRVTGWVARALLCQMQGEFRAMLAACRRGLEVLDQHRLTLGATESRATATTHGRELANLALRRAVVHNDPRQAMRWTARLRSTASLPPAARGISDASLLAELSAMREISRQLAVHQGGEAVVISLRRQRAQLESSIRSRALRRDGPSASAVSEPSSAHGWTALEGVVFVELFEVDDTLHAVTAWGTNIRMHEVGSAALASSALEHAHALLRRIARGRDSQHQREALRAAGRALQTRLLGSAAAEIERSRSVDGPVGVVVVAPARHYAAPWTLLPALDGRSVALSPSAHAWRQTATTNPQDGGRVVLVSGPGLVTRGGEIAHLAQVHGSAVVLTGARATVERVLSAIDGAALAHVATHGVFRSDNPQFSALLLDDGPLTVFDLERLRQAPHRIVLASCDSGRMAPVGADDLLGLVTCLISLGTVGVMAPISAVNDEATVHLMTAIHELLARGYSLPDAARQVRAAAAATEDPMAIATAASFLVFGA
jgi:tetratricopeptide (TPR) repeat protein